MAGWSTTAPSGVTWSGWVDSGVIKPNYYQYYAATRIARGAQNTIYVHVRLCATCYDYDHRGITITLRGQVSIGNTSSYKNSSEYSASLGYYPGGWTVVKDIYYTATAAPGTKAYARAYCSAGGYTSACTLTAPAYTTTYAIRYYGNGDDAGSTANQTKTYGTAVTIYGCSWGKTGYAFSHWNTKADGSGTSYVTHASYSTNAALTLYAIWVPNTYAVNYDANGGEGVTEGQTKIYGEALALRECGFTKEGHGFARWNTKADGTGTSYAAGGSYTANAVVTLYAIWEPDTYAVRYDPNGGEGSVAAQVKTWGRTLLLSAGGFTRKSWDFLGWNTEADGSGTSYAAGGSYTENAPAVLYAQWRKRNIPVYVNDGGVIRQAEKAYVNAGGVVREAVVYVNADGIVYAVE